MKKYLKDWTIWLILLLLSVPVLLKCFSDLPITWVGVIASYVIFMINFILITCAYKIHSRYFDSLCERIEENDETTRN